LVSQGCVGLCPDRQAQVQQDDSVEADDRGCLRGLWTGIGSRSVGPAVTWSGTGTKPRIRFDGMLLLCASLLGGTHLSIPAYGVVVFVVYGIAFIGGWIEQIGSSPFTSGASELSDLLVGCAAVNAVVASLVALWYP